MLLLISVEPGCWQETMFASKASRTSRTSTTLAKEETCLVANGCNWISGIDLQIQLIRKSGVGGNFLWQFIYLTCFEHV